MIYRIEKLSTKELYKYRAEELEYKEKYKNKYSRNLPLNTLIFRRISVLGCKLDYDTAKRIICRHIALFGVKVVDYTLDKGDLIMYCDFTTEELKTIKLQKGDINKMRTEINSITYPGQGGILSRLKKITRK